MAKRQTAYVPAADPEVGGWEPDQPPRRPGVTLGAVLSRWWLILIPAIALCAAGIAAAERRAPVWTATSQLNVGKLDVQAQALPGFVEAAQSLASTYSRFVESPRVVDAVARRTGISPRSIADRLSATVVPASPVFAISADGSTDAAAVTLARSATTQLQDEVARLNTLGNRPGAALQRYREAAALAQRRAQERDELRARHTSNPTSRSRRRLDAKTVDADAARLRADAIGQQYQARLQDDIGSARLEVLRLPSSATSDRLTTLQRYGFVGFAGGLLAARRAHRLA